MRGRPRPRVTLRAICPKRSSTSSSGRCASPPGSATRTCGRWGGRCSTSPRRRRGCSGTTSSGRRSAGAATARSRTAPPPSRSPSRHRRPGPYVALSETLSILRLPLARTPRLTEPAPGWIPPTNRRCPVSRDGALVSAPVSGGALVRGRGGARGGGVADRRFFFRGRDGATPSVPATGGGSRRPRRSPRRRRLFTARGPRGRSRRSRRRSTSRRRPTTGAGAGGRPPTATGRASKRRCVGRGSDRTRHL